MKMRGKKSEPVKETQMVSLADIAFLIIFFFMLSSQFMKDRTQMHLPELPKSKTTKAQISVSMAMVDNSPVIKVDGDVTDKNALENKLRDMLAGKKPEDCEVRFKCDKAIPHKYYRTVYESISNAGGIICIMHDVSK